MSDFKTNFFGSFLDTMNATPNKVATAGRTAARPASTSAADAVMQTLLKHDGTANVKDLLPHTSFSVDGLIELLDTLDSFGFVKRDGGTVVMTPAGREAAAGKP